MDYRTVADLAACIRTRVPARLPRDTELVVGIPHGGMVAASLLALRLGLPVTDVDGYVARRGRMRPKLHPRHVLLVDDSVTTGLRCEAARRAVASTADRHGDRITTLAVYGVPGTVGGCDITLEDVELPRLFEWSYMHHAILSEACVAFDGVLCPEPDPARGAGYRAFLKRSSPLMLPDVEVGTIVSCLPGRHRTVIEEWLASHGVRYRSLVLADAPASPSESAPLPPWRFKADALERSRGRLFVESDPVDAKAIAGRTRLPVLCTSINQLLCAAPDSGGLEADCS